MKESLGTTEAPPPQEMRDLMRIDSARVTDPHLLALLLATCSRRQREGQPEKNWTAMELAEELYAELGGKLTYLMEAGRICRQRFGLGAATCGRLSAGIWLASPRHMPTTGKKSEAELIAAVLGAEEPDREGAERLLDAFWRREQSMPRLPVVGWRFRQRLEIARAVAAVAGDQRETLNAGVRAVHRAAGRGAGHGESGGQATVGGVSDAPTMFGGTACDRPL